MPRATKDLALAREVVRVLEGRPKPKATARARPARPPLSQRWLAFDDRLAAVGVPPATPWWREGLVRWLEAYERHDVLELVACVGRGAAKSTALYKLATFFALEGDFQIPAAERHYAVIISLIKGEGAKAIAIIPNWLTLLGVPHTRHGDVIDLDGAPRGIRVIASSVASTSGWRAFLVAKDERSKWPSSDVSDVEADEIDTSASAMTATHARSPILSFGSAWAAEGAFYEAVTAGTTDSRVVLGPAPTWIAAPHITEQSTRRKEASVPRWRREYACEFQQDSEDGLFTAAMLDRAERADGEDLPPEPGVTYVGAQDVAFVRNAWTFAVGALRRSRADGRVRRSVVLVRQWRGRPEAPLQPEIVLRQIAEICRRYRVTTIDSDQYERFSLSEIARRPEINLHLSCYHHGSLESRCEALLTWLTDGDVELPRDPVVRRDLLAVRQKFTAKGYTVSLPVSSDGRHCDYVPTLTMLLAACVTPADERARLSPEDRIEAEATRADEEAFGSPAKPYWDAGRKGPNNRAKPYWKDGPAAQVSWQPTPYGRRRG